MNAACPSDGKLELLLANQLDQAEEQALERHVVACDACQRRLDEVTHFRGTLPTNFDAGDAGDIHTGAPGVLARLAISLKPVMRMEEKKANKKDSCVESSWRMLGGSQRILASGRFLRRQAWTWPLIAAALVGSAGWWVHRSVEWAMRQQRINELTTVLEADVAALRSWMENQRVMAELVAADEQLGPMVQKLLPLWDSTPESRSRLVREPAQAVIRSRLAESLRRGGFTGFLVISPAGIALAVDEDAPVGAALSGYRRDFFARVCGGQAATSKPFLSPLLQADDKGELRAGQPCMYAAAPLYDENGRPIAALGLQIRPDDQFTQILQVARSGSTGETYAFDRDGLLLSESRFDDQLKQIGLLVDRTDSSSILNVELRDPGVNMTAGDRPTMRRGDQPLTRMAQAAVRGIDGCDAEGYRDYRGVPVVGAWRWLSDYDFGVATEIDVREAFAPVSILRRAFAVLMSLLAAAAGAIFVAMLVMARQQRRLHDATRAAQQFGQYTLVEKLGSGGMGTVYKARHALLRRPTAVKLLNPETMSDTAVARFEREVQLTSGLTHPNTVAIYDYGRTPAGIFYYAMEYLEGTNLDELVRKHGPLPQERVVHILRQVCASLGEAHAAGLIHRDVKPANIILTIRGGQHDFVKVLDFGLARPVEQREASLTSTNTIAGTPLYVAPEAITRPEGISASADVYAIGAVGYFLLTGSPVFSGSSAVEICLKHVNERPAFPSALRRQPVHSYLEALLLRCLAKSPIDRPQDALELLGHLETCPGARDWMPTDAARWWADRAHQHLAVNAIFTPVEDRETLTRNNQATRQR